MASVSTEWSASDIETLTSILKFEKECSCPTFALYQQCKHCLSMKFRRGIELPLPSDSEIPQAKTGRPAKTRISHESRNKKARLTPKYRHSYCILCTKHCGNPPNLKAHLNGTPHKSEAKSFFQSLSNKESKCQWKGRFSTITIA